MKMLVSLLVAATAVFSSQLQVFAASDVQLDVYYESLCPDCYEFFLNQLKPVAVKLEKYLMVNVFPYGNAQTIRDGETVTFKCQHGASECLLNKIHACGLERLSGSSDLKKVLFTSCLFNYYKNPLSAGKTCSGKFGLDWNTIITCAQGAEGNQLEDRYGNATIPHPGVPYVAVDKYVGDDDFQNAIDSNLLGVVCRSLSKKGVKPTECQGS